MSDWLTPKPVTLISPEELWSVCTRAYKSCPQNRPYLYSDKPRATLHEETQAWLRCDTLWKFGYSRDLPGWAHDYFERVRKASMDAMKEVALNCTQLCFLCSAEKTYKELHLHKDKLICKDCHTKIHLKTRGLVCIECNQDLIPAIDGDPNGDQGPTCAKCLAEQAHDFDAEPNAVFARNGERITGLVSYRSKNDQSPNPVRFMQYVKDPIPKWATDLRQEKETQ